jgi:cholestenol delta-isomerase
MQNHAGSGQGHPYFPQDAIIPGYAPNSSPLLAILGAFGGIVGTFVLGCVTLARWYSSGLKRADQLTVAWFALCECDPFSHSPPGIPPLSEYAY